mmetsp:Transcript_12765/g.26884  ORF Transcript_12765/g.26884 Transcript_12765/m.26884 type:complete len:131 (+) Transcript_12765:247-639(+)|eukprot:CAMPEP_0171333178 /NCGR_PEP_ID=MMETSP0878-20121228/3859_1 /TAXON_ID=67004 /ORGANISM="Thalassiosira weissflogii, Strain CCMP1336" /LENGTH=130 /DNA_ID=CAMNT_0011834091 /DNA_START=187 /DNA_END=579 /DNA_ORIENTATION=+
MSHYQTPDSKKEEFRRYLEKSGAIESLTSVLVGLYEEPDRPIESTEYIKKYLGAATASSARGSSAASLAETEKLRKENEELKSKVIELNRTIETLRANLSHARKETKKANAAAAEALAAAEAAGAKPPST